MKRNEESKKTGFLNVKDGETFLVGGIEFIKFPEIEEGTPVVAKDAIFRSEFGENNNFSESVIFGELKNSVLPRIVGELGEENVRTFKTDLTTLDGLKPYEDLESKISLVTLDFYRKHAEIFEWYKLDRWWWLATAFSAPPHDDPDWILCVSPSGTIGSDYNCGNVNGVRPFLIFESSIFVSDEE